MSAAGKNGTDYLQKVCCGVLKYERHNARERKRWRATALQDATAFTDGPRTARSVLECASPLALWGGRYFTRSTTNELMDALVGTGSMPNYLPYFLRNTKAIRTSAEIRIIVRAYLLRADEESI